MTTVTCIIPVHNAKTTIERAVKSAVYAGCDQVFVYDDACSDGSDELIYDLQETCEQLSYYSRCTDVVAGVNFGRNYLCGCVKNGLIIPLDADDTLQDITPLRDAWQPGAWVYGDYYQVEGKQITRIPGSPAGVLSRREVTGITFMFHKDDWLKVGGYDPDFAYCEDWAFQCNLTHHGVKPIYVETPVYTRYLKANGNERTSLAGEYWPLYKAMAQRKYPSLFQVNR